MHFKILCSEHKATSEASNIPNKTYYVYPMYQLLKADKFQTCLNNPIIFGIFVRIYLIVPYTQIDC